MTLEEKKDEGKIEEEKLKVEGGKGNSGFQQLAEDKVKVGGADDDEDGEEKKAKKKKKNKKKSKKN